MCTISRDIRDFSISHWPTHTHPSNRKSTIVYYRQQQLSYTRHTAPFYFQTYPTTPPTMFRNLGNAKLINGD